MRTSSRVSCLSYCSTATDDAFLRDLESQNKIMPCWACILHDKDINPKDGSSIKSHDNITFVPARSMEVFTISASEFDPFHPDKPLKWIWSAHNCRVTSSGGVRPEVHWLGYHLHYRPYLEIHSPKNSNEIRHEYTMDDLRTDDREFWEGIYEELIEYCKNIILDNQDKVDFRTMLAVKQYIEDNPNASNFQIMEAFNMGFSRISINTKNIDFLKQEIYGESFSMAEHLRLKEENARLKEQFANLIAEREKIRFCADLIKILCESQDDAILRALDTYNRTKLCNASEDARRRYLAYYSQMRANASDFMEGFTEISDFEEISF